MEWKRSEPSAAGYQFARRAHYLGRWILHSGWYPDYKLRLFDRRRGRWQGAYVHESVVVNGPVATLPGEILHYTCNSLEEHRQRIEFYTDLAAKEMFERGESVSFPAARAGPSWIFLNSYLLRLGMLDGRQGYLIAKMAARYVRRKYAKLEEMRKSVQPTTMNPPSALRIAHIDTGLSLRGGQRQMLTAGAGPARAWARADYRVPGRERPGRAGTAGRLSRFFPARERSLARLRHFALAPAAQNLGAANSCMPTTAAGRPSRG